MIICGIDQSYTSTGIMISDDGVIAAYRTICTKKEDHPLEKFHRSQEISNQIVEICKEYKVDQVNIEGLAMGRSIGNSNRDLAGLQFMIVNALIFAGYSVINIVAPTALKKFATGKGNAKKEEMFDNLPLTMVEELSKIPKSKGRFDLTDAYFLSMFDK